MQLKAIEWLGVLSDLRADAVDAAVSEWVRTESKWPKPADIRRKVLDAIPSSRPSYQAEPFKKRDPGADARMARMIEIRDKHKHSETPMSDTFNDPAYQDVLRDYTCATGRQPA